jgi:hypothetical protein
MAVSTQPATANPIAIPSPSPPLVSCPEESRATLGPSPKYRCA